MLCAWFFVVSPHFHRVIIILSALAHRLSSFKRVYNNNNNNNEYIARACSSGSTARTLRSESQLKSYSTFFAIFYLAAQTDFVGARVPIKRERVSFSKLVWLLFSPIAPPPKAVVVILCHVCVRGNGYFYPKEKKIVQIRNTTLSCKNN